MPTSAEAYDQYRKLGQQYADALNAASQNGWVVSSNEGSSRGLESRSPRQIFKKIKKENPYELD